MRRREISETFLCPFEMRLHFTLLMVRWTLSVSPYSSEKTHGNRIKRAALTRAKLKLSMPRNWETEGRVGNGELSVYTIMNRSLWTDSFAILRFTTEVTPATRTLTTTASRSSIQSITRWLLHPFSVLLASYLCLCQYLQSVWTVVNPFRMRRVESRWLGRGYQHSCVLSEVARPSFNSLPFIFDNPRVLLSLQLVLSGKELSTSW